MVQFLILDGPLSGQVATHHETFRSSGELQTTPQEGPSNSHIFTSCLFLFYYSFYSKILLFNIKNIQKL